MKKFISGIEIADTMEIHHRRRIKALKEKGIIPRLAIIQTIDSPIIDTYVRVKKKYAEKLGILVEYHKDTTGNLKALSQIITRLNDDASIQGIIIQLPVHESFDREVLIDSIYHEKDVDGLCSHSPFIPPTALAIMKLLNEYVPGLHDKKIALIGNGRLVGNPVGKELIKNGLSFRLFSENDNLNDIHLYNVIISATGSPSLLKSNYVASESYIFDAGTAEDGLKITGDVSDELYERKDVFVTPKIGGIGILTVRMLFENLIQACEKSFD